MQFKQTKIRSGNNRRGFTLVEALAALVFMAIVIPVAVHGLQVANLAGVVSERKNAAGRIAQRVLNETLAGDQTSTSGQGGSIENGAITYRWRMRTESWTEPNMRLVTVTVTFPAQGSDYDLSLSTLAAIATQ